MKSTQLILQLTASMVCSTTLLAGDWTSIIFSGDADSGINSALNYTAKADFRGTGTVNINGVAFTDTGMSGTNYALSGANGDLGGWNNGVGGSIGAGTGATSNFFYTNDGGGNASMTLSGLNTNTEYVASWHSASWGGHRFIDITPSDTNTAFRINQDANTHGQGSVLRYAFTANAPSITFNFNAVSDGDSFHH